MNNNKGYTSISEKDIELADQTNNVIQVERGNSNIQVIKKKSDIDFVKKNSNTDLLSHEVEIHDEFNADFEFNHIGLTTNEATIRLEKYGLNQLPEKKTPKWYIFASQLWQPMPLMIWAAAIIEAAIENWIDFAILIFIQFANASIAFYEITKAADAVEALKKSLKPLATVKRDG